MSHTVSRTGATADGARWSAQAPVVPSTLVLAGLLVLGGCRASADIPTQGAGDGAEPAVCTLVRGTQDKVHVEFDLPLPADAPDPALGARGYALHASDEEPQGDSQVSTGESTDGAEGGQSKAGEGTEDSGGEGAGADSTAANAPVVGEEGGKAIYRYLASRLELSHGGMWRNVRAEDIDIEYYDGPAEARAPDALSGEIFLVVDDSQSMRAVKATVAQAMMRASLFCGERLTRQAHRLRIRLYRVGVDELGDARPIVGEMFADERALGAPGVWFTGFASPAGSRKQPDVHQVRFDKSHTALYDGLSDALADARAVAGDHQVSVVVLSDGFTDIVRSRQGEERIYRTTESLLGRPPKGRRSTVDEARGLSPSIARLVSELDAVRALGDRVRLHVVLFDPYDEEAESTRVGRDSPIWATTQYIDPTGDFEPAEQEGLPAVPEDIAELVKTMEYDTPIDLVLPGEIRAQVTLRVEADEAPFVELHVPSRAWRARLRLPPEGRMQAGDLVCPSRINPEYMLRWMLSKGAIKRGEGTLHDINCGFVWLLRNAFLESPGDASAPFHDAYREVSFTDLPTETEVAGNIQTLCAQFEDWFDRPPRRPKRIRLRLTYTPADDLDFVGGPAWGQVDVRLRTNDRAVPDHFECPLEGLVERPESSVLIQRWWASGPLGVLALLLGGLGLRRSRRIQGEEVGHG